MGDRIDEAVEVGLAAYNAGNASDLGGLIENVILAALPVLLGEPVAWQYRFNHPLPNGGMCDWHTAAKEDVDALPRLSYDVRPVYAPDLGGGNATQPLTPTNED